MTSDYADDRGAAMLSSLAVVADRDDRWSAEARARVRERVWADVPLARRRRWRHTALALAGTAVALGGGAAAAATIFRGEPAPEEVRSYATDAGIPEATARGELLDQRQLPALVEAARERLGDAYAGVWVDADGSRRIVLALAANAAPGAEADARAAVTTADLDGKVDIVRRPHGERELERLRSTIMGELGPINRGAPSTIDVEVDLADSAVIVRRPPREATVAQSRYLKSLRRRYGTELKLADSPGELQLFGRDG